MRDVPAGDADEMDQRRPPAPVPIASHGVIGDQMTAALVAADGTIGFCCWPRFDGLSIFASLLDPERGGYFSLTSALAGAARSQSYIPDTNVLVTRTMAPAGLAEITDFMPLPAQRSRPMLMRRLRVIRGELHVRACCAPRLDYGRAETRAAAAENGTIVWSAEGVDTRLRLVASAPLAACGARATGAWTLRAGDAVNFVLLDADGATPVPEEVEAAYRATVSYWQGWAGRMRYRGRWREMVARSALVLKVLTSAEHGSVVAAATFGLPEAPGGERNWDYRATWVRDASFTTYALMRLGYTEEAGAFMRWLAKHLGGPDWDGAIAPIYALDGENRLDEEELSHFAGYGGARPVRIGNAAHTQVQLDVYGELLDSVYLNNKYGEAISYEGWVRVRRTAEYVIAHWRDPDQGIWEFRGPPRHWLHSRVMCWVALDRAVRLAQKRSLPAPLGDWRRVRDDIHASVWSEFWNAERGHFVAEAGGTELDAAMLMLPLVRFVSATDPRWLATLDAIARDLGSDVLIHRYRIDDGLAGDEGAFTTCSFWYAECLARAGRHAEARLQFERMLSFANPLGLYAEQIGLSGEQLGNTPQALTHLALISAAVYLDRVLSGEGETQWRP